MSLLHTIFLFVFIFSSALSIYSKMVKTNWYKYTKTIPLFLLLVFSVIIGFPGEYHSSGWFFICGLLAGITGDFFLLDEKRFIHGLAAFLTGHLLYITGFLTESSGLGLSVYPLLIAAGLIYLFPVLKAIKQKKKNKYRFPVIFYFAVILFLVSASVQNTFFAKTMSFSVVAGTVLFTISDGLLAYNKFVAENRYRSSFVSVSYYAAQYCIITGGLHVI